jgi:hypothetical protein
MNSRLDFEQTAHSNTALQLFLGDASWGSRELVVNLTFDNGKFRHPITDKIVVESTDGLYKIYCESFYSFDVRSPLWSSYSYFRWDENQKVLYIEFPNGKLEFSRPK